MYKSKYFCNNIQENKFAICLTKAYTLDVGFELSNS